MKDRIYDLMKTLGKNPSDFASAIEISPALLSSIKSGRTKPTVYLMEKIKAVYPNVNMNWLITGEGDMFISTEQPALIVQSNNCDSDKNQMQNIKNESMHSVSNQVAEPEIDMKVENKSDENVYTADKLKKQNNSTQIEQSDSKDKWYVKTMVSPESKSISQIIVLFDDGTFETLKK